MPDRSAIKKFRVYDALIPGVQNTLNKCLSVTNLDVVTLIGDRSTIEPLAAFISVLESGGIKYHAFILEYHGDRPARGVSANISHALRESTVSIYGVNPIPGEYDHRVELVSIIETQGVRHAHMIGLSGNTLMVGMAADYTQIDKLGKLIIAKLNQCNKIQIKSFSGTNLTVVPDRTQTPKSSAGLITQHEWQNLPNGEVTFMPEAIEGVYVCDGHLPDVFTVDRASLTQIPAMLKFDGTRVVDITGGPGDLAARMKAEIASEQNLDRVGFFSVGTNFAIRAWSGSMVFDLYSPGVSFALGNPAGLFQLENAPHKQLPLLGRRISLFIDEEPIIKSGRYVESILEQVQ